MIDLKNYSKGNYSPNAGFGKIILWIFISRIFFENPLFVFVKPKRFILKLFGAKIGEGFYLKPSVKIKYPWFLIIGNNVSIGENVWIDNLDYIKISDNVVISQNVYLLTGNHDYTSRYFDLFVKEIIIEEGVWIGASSVICPGVICKKYSIISVGAVVNKNTNEFGIYFGNPAIEIKKRVFKN